MTEARAVAHIRFGEFAIDVVSEDERLIARLNSYYSNFAPTNGSVKKPVRLLHAVVGHEAVPSSVELVPWGTKGKESYCDIGSRRLIRKDRTGALIVLGGATWRMTGDLHREFSQLLNVICSADGVWLLEQTGGAMFHASAAVQGGKAIAIIGQSGSGKSSVTVRLLEHGFDFLTNDRLMVSSRRGRVVADGLPKLPRVNPGTLLASKHTRHVVDAKSRKAYERLKPADLWMIEEKHDLDVRKTLRRRWLLSAPLACALVLDWRGDGPTTLQRLSAGGAVDAIRATTKSFGPFDKRLGMRSDSALLELAQKVPVFRVSGKVDPSGLAAEIARHGASGLVDSRSRSQTTLRAYPLRR